MADRFESVFDRMDTEKGVVTAPTSSVEGNVVAASPDRFESVFDQMDKVKQEQDGMSWTAGKTIPEAEAVDVISLSDHFKVAPDFAARNAQQLRAQKRVEDSDFALVKNSAPVVSKWATENPYNSSLAMDDIKNLAKIEEMVKDHVEDNSMAGFMQKAFLDAVPVLGEYRKFKRDVEKSPLAQYGLAQAGLTAARIPGGLASTGALGVNVGIRDKEKAPFVQSAVDAALPGVGAALGAIGKIDEAVNPEGGIVEPPRVLLDNPLTRYLEDKMKSIDIPEMNASVTEEIASGNYRKAGKALAYQFAANAPTQALIIASTLINPAAGIGAIVGVGAGTAGTATKEAQDAGLSPLAAQTRGAFHGAAEAGLEYVGTFGILKHWSGALAKSFGKDTARKVMSDMLKTITYAFAGEANEEASTEAVQYATDVLTGYEKEPFSFKEMGVRMADAALQGGVMGLGMTGPSAIGAGVARAGMIQESNRAKNFYLSLGDSVESTKLRHRLPEKVYEVVSRITKDGPVENIFIPTEAFETYAQSEKIDPVVFAQSIGALETYKEAREGSGLVKIPLSEWVGKVVGTEAYKRLADDIKFSPTKMTVNESIKFQEQMKKTAEERAPEADSLGKIYDDFKSKVLSVGYTPAEADAHAMLMAERARTRSRILGEDPFALYQKENIQIRRFQKPDQIAQTEDIQFNQSLPDDWQTGPARAVFRGWQDQGAFGDPFPVYNIIGEHPRQRSTVAETTLKSMGIDVPATPAFDEWAKSDPVQALRQSPVTDQTDTQTFDATNPSILFQAAKEAEAPVFYSQLAKTIDEKMPNSAPVSMVKALLDPAKGNVKKDEVDWSGINEWLAGKDKVTKAEVLDFLKSNEVQIKDVTLGENRIDASLKKNVFGILKRNDDLGFDSTRAALESIKHEWEVDNWQWNNEQDKETVRRYAIAKEDLNKRQPKFSSYQLPGGENYREVLLTLPVSDPNKISLPSDMLIKRRNDGKFVVWSKYGSAGYDFLAGNSEQEAISNYSKHMDKLGSDSSAKPGIGDFRSSHFDEPNIIAHVRMNERTTADGKKVLFLEEVQSDWHQKGREQGYVGQYEKLYVDAENEFKNIHVKKDGIRYVANVDGVSIADYSEVGIHNAVVNHLVEKERAKLGFSGSPVPDAPFKKSWHELALKRILRMSVDQGYDGIAWTTGEQQAARYDLSKQIHFLNYRKNDDGTFDISAEIEHRGTPIGKDIPAEKLADYVGKDVAQKIVNNGGVEVNFAGNNEPKKIWKSLSGVDLKVGGAGMKGFYDQIIPSFLNKYTKKWGGRVGETEIYASKENIGGPVAQRPGESVSDASRRMAGKVAKAITVNALDITPSMRESISKGQPLFQGEGKSPRAQVRFGNQSINIDLFKKSDMSSLLHEMSHVFAREMGQDLDSIRSKDQTALNFEQIQYIQDAENLLKWVKADSFSTMTTEQHEKIARGMETYFREGKAPSVALQGSFARFREWLLMIYRAVTGLNVEITKDVQEVFDRMFASQEEINIAKEDLGSSPLFSDAKSVGMTDSDAKKYAAALRDAQVAGEEALATKVMAEMKRKEMRPYLDRLAQVKDEVSAEVNQRIEYIALSVLQRGKLPNGDPLPNDMVPIKLSRKAIVDTYGEEHLDLLPKPYVYSRQNGAHPEEAAVIFGFKDGETLLRTLETLEPKDKVIDALVEQKMKAEFGDMKSDGTIAKEAMDAVHNDKRAELLKKEMEYLVSEDFSTFKKVVRRVARPVPSVNHVREQAKAVIGQLTPREIYPSMYSRSESKASREAIELMLKGDINGAFDAKLKERLNHELFRAATEAKDNVDAMVDYFKKFEEPKTREIIGKAGGSYLEQIEGLLERFDFKKSVTLRALDKRKSLVQWVTENSDQISLDDISPELLNEANRRHYKETPYETLSAMFDTVKTIEHLARYKNKLLANDRARTLDAAIDDITASIMANHSVNNEPVPIESTLKERFLDKTAELITNHAKMEFVAEILDGKSKLGPVFRNVIEPLLKSGDKEADIIHDASNKMKEIFGVYTKNERATWYYKKIFIPKINQYLYKPTILSIGMNQGNAYNKEAILEGMRGLGHPEWTQDHIDAILETLDARDIGVINNTMELINSYWGEASGLEKRVKGVAPEKVVGEPYRVKNGTINGGYYPIKFDHKRSWVSMKRAEKQMALDLAGGHWAKTMTQKGHLKERTNTGGQPIRTDLGVINEHIQDVVHDFTHREAIIDVNRIINDDRFRVLIEKTIGKAFYGEFQPWLNSIATTVRTESISWMEALAAHAKKGVTVVALGLKVSSGLMQTAGYGNTVKELGEKYALIGLRQMGQNGANLKNLWDQISEKSVEMRYRLSTYDRDVRDTMAKMNATGTKRGLLSVPDIYTADMANAFFGFIGMMDLAMSIPSWLGAYQKAMDGKVKGIEKANEKDAVLYADQVVRMTQSANRVMDLARVQRGNQLIKLFTMFYSQMSIQFNQMMKTGMMVGQPGGKADVIRAFIYMVFFQAVVSDFIRGRSKDDDEEWLNRIAKDMAFIPFETMIFVRDMASALNRFGYSGSPAFDVGNTLTGAAKAIGSRVFGDKEELTEADMKKIVKSAGYVFALPTGQAWKTAEYLHAWMLGNEEPDNVMQGVWKALVTGKTRK